MPEIKSNAEDMYLRATPIPRALESLQEAFWGMYPASARTLDFPPPVIVARQFNEETLFPNEGGCKRFRQLARLFADRAAARCMSLSVRICGMIADAVDLQGMTLSKWLI